MCTGELNYTESTWKTNADARVYQTRPGSCKGDKWDMEQVWRATAVAEPWNAQKNMRPIFFRAQSPVLGLLLNSPCEK